MVGSLVCVGLVWDMESKNLCLCRACFWWTLMQTEVGLKRV